MAKSLRILLSVFLAASFIFTTACSRKQGPTQYDDTGPMGGGLGDYDDDLIPATDLGEWGPGGEGLELRGDGIGDGYYNGRRMREDVLPSVYFGFDSASVSASERSKVQEAAEYLMDNSDAGILIEGHCDWYGTSEYNLALGDRRASSVADYLGTLGISSDRIETLSKGSLEATSGLSKSQASEDRRADLIVLE
ncbi:MAG: OmpA family protein [Opitutales bacterium]